MQIKYFADKTYIKNNFYKAILISTLAQIPKLGQDFWITKNNQTKKVQNNAKTHINKIKKSRSKHLNSKNANRVEEHKIYTTYRRRHKLSSAAAEFKNEQTSEHATRSCNFIKTCFIEHH